MGRARWVILAAASFFALTGVASAATTSEAQLHRPAIAAKPCSAGYKHAIIGGAHKCLRRGQFCARRYDRQYHRYRFHCHTGRLTGGPSAVVRVAPPPLPPPVPPVDNRALERQWGTRLAQWGQTWVAQVRDQVGRLNGTLIVQRDPIATADWLSFLSTVRACSTTLEQQVGSPPTARLQPGYNLMVQGCAQLVRGADLLNQGVILLNLGLVTQGSADVQAGLALITAGVQQLNTVLQQP